MLHSSALRTNDDSTARALLVVVRRILRTQTQRTQLQKMVLREERRIRNSHSEPLSNDSMAEVIAAKLRQRLPQRMFKQPSAGVRSVTCADWPTVMQDA